MGDRLEKLEIPIWICRLEGFLSHLTPSDLSLDTTHIQCNIRSKGVKCDKTPSNLQIHIGISSFSNLSPTIHSTPPLFLKLKLKYSTPIIPYHKQITYFILHKSHHTHSYHIYSPRLSPTYPHSNRPPFSTIEQVSHIQY